MGARAEAPMSSTLPVGEYPLLDPAERERERRQGGRVEWERGEESWSGVST